MSGLKLVDFKLVSLFLSIALKYSLVLCAKLFLKQGVCQQLIICLTYLYFSIFLNSSQYISIFQYFNISAIFLEQGVSQQFTICLIYSVQRTTQENQLKMEYTNFSFLTFYNVNCASNSISQTQVIKTKCTFWQI